MMKALSNSSPKDCEYLTDGDKNSLEMKCLNSNCESSINSSCESTSLGNSMDKLGLETDSLLNSHESVSTSLPSVCASKESYISQDSGTGRTVPSDLQLVLKRQGLTVEDLMQTAPPFAVSWKSARNVFQCLTCATPIDFLSRKYHCWNCGEVFCKRCIDKQCSLPGHYSDNRVPVCKQCYKVLKKFK